jgi:hypothetical protein
MSNNPISAQELLDKLDAAKKLTRREQVRDRLSVSRHRFQDDDRLRDGHITQGLLDRPVLAIIQVVEGEEVVAELKALKRGTPRENISSTLEYYSIAAECIIDTHGKGEHISKLSLAMEPYRTENLAYRLLEQCVLVWDLLAEYDASVEGQELRFMSEALRLSESYHKMMVSLIERDSLSRLKEGAQLRAQDQQNSPRRRQSMRLVRKYIEKRQSRKQGWKLSEIHKYVKTNYVPDMDEKPPSRNTLGDWMSSAGIDLSK